ncbi:MAG TPA: hypothetical protein VKZ96_05685 [Thermomicrobiales bacterium]|nr:hypothetical protein [Thermomicrobiales bacterium]
MLQRFRQESRLAQIVILLFVVTQVLVPAYLLLGPRPAHFGWQMYSGVRTLSEFTTIDASGQAREIEPNDYLGNPRLEIDLTTALPAHICATQPAVVAVQARNPITDEVVATPCSR